MAYATCVVIERLGSHHSRGREGASEGQAGLGLLSGSVRFVSIGEQNDCSLLGVGPMHMKEGTTGIPAAQAAPFGVASGRPGLGMYVWVISRYAGGRG